MISSFNANFKQLVSIVFLFIGVFSFASCETAGKRWRIATEENSIASYEAFIAQYPLEDESILAKKRIEDLVFAAANKSDTVPDYLDYCQKYPRGNHVAEAKDRIETLHWNIAQKTETPAGYNEFLKAHPRGQFARAAQNKLAHFAWVEATKINTSDSYKNFIRAYPNAQLIGEARQRRDEAQKKEAKEAAIIKRKEARLKPLRSGSLFDVFYPSTSFQIEYLAATKLQRFHFFEITFIVDEKDKIKLDEFRNLAPPSPGHIIYTQKTCNAVLVTTEGERLFIKNLRLNARNTVRTGWRADGRLYRHSSWKLPIKNKEGDSELVSFSDLASLKPSPTFTKSSELSFVDRSGNAFSGILDLESLKKSSKSTYLSDAGILAEVSSHVIIFIPFSKIQVVEFND